MLILNVVTYALCTSTEFAGTLFVTTRMTVQLLLLPTLVNQPNVTQTILKTTYNLTFKVNLAFTTSSILGNLLIAIPDSLDCDCFSAGNKFYAAKVPAAPQQTQQSHSLVCQTP